MIKIYSKNFNKPEIKIETQVVDSLGLTVQLQPKTIDELSMIYTALRKVANDFDPLLKTYNFTTEQSVKLAELLMANIKNLFEIPENRFGGYFSNSLEIMQLLDIAMSGEFVYSYILEA